MIAFDVFFYDPKWPFSVSTVVSAVMLAMARRRATSEWAKGIGQLTRDAASNP
jgi:hypothetical protein